MSTRTPGPPGSGQRLDLAGLRREVVAGVLRVDAELDRVAAERDLVLAQAQRVSGREPDLLDDQVDPGQRLGHRVLDLDPAVDLDEVEVAIRVQQELEGPGALVSGRDDAADGEVAQALAGGIVHRR